MRGGTRNRKFIIESSSTERKPVGRLRKPTQKRRIIIESSSLLPVTPPKTKKRKNTKAKSDVKRGQTKKKRFIIASSSKEEIKEKNESPKTEKNGQQKIDLKVSPDIKPMASTAHPLPSGLLYEIY